MSSKYILAIDQSTSASKVMLFDQEARLLHRITKPHQQHYPRQGFVEHDPLEIFDNVITGMNEVVEEAYVSIDAIAAVAITNQRETAMIWDRNTGKPIYNAVVWQCQRGAPFCDQLKQMEWKAIIQSRTGLIIDPYFSASKLRWIMMNVPDAEEKARHGDLLLGTMDTWLLWKLTGGKVHATDFSNACRTMLFDIRKLRWDEELIELFKLQPSMFPGVYPSDTIFGETESNVPFDIPIPISGLIGDSHGALFGHKCFSPGSGKATYGTGSSVMMNIGKEWIDPPGGLVTSIGFSCGEEIDYVLEGNIHCAGDTINWLKNELELIQDESEIERTATSIKDNHGVYLVPAFVGLGAPYWDNEARACIVGLSRDAGKAHIIRAALESIAYQVKDLIDLIRGNTPIKLQELRTDGGPTKNDFLMQFQSDMLHAKVIRSDIEEISALGSVFLAGLATGIWQNKQEIIRLRGSYKTYLPKLPLKEANRIYAEWQKAVAKSRYH